MTNKPKRIGRMGENAASGYYRETGLFPEAEPRALFGEHDRGDITNTPGLCTQVKSGKYAESASLDRIREWMSDLDSQQANCGAKAGLLVRKRAGYSGNRIEYWYAHMWASQLYGLIYAIGHPYLLGKVTDICQLAPASTPAAVVSMSFGEAVQIMHKAELGV